MSVLLVNSAQSFERIRVCVGEDPKGSVQFKRSVHDRSVDEVEKIPCYEVPS